MHFKAVRAFFSCRSACAFFSGRSTERVSLRVLYPCSVRALSAPPPQSAVFQFTLVQLGQCRKYQHQHQPVTNLARKRAPARPNYQRRWWVRAPGRTHGGRRNVCRSPCDHTVQCSRHEVEAWDHDELQQRWRRYFIIVSD